MNANDALKSAIEYAANAGFEFAQQCLTEDFEHTREFRSNDEMPEGDYVDFCKRYGGSFLVEMEAEYRKAFNAKIADDKLESRIVEASSEAGEEYASLRLSDGDAPATGSGEIPEVYSRDIMAKTNFGSGDLETVQAAFWQAYADEIASR